MNPYTVSGKYQLSAIYVVLDIGLAWIGARLLQRWLPGLPALAFVTGKTARIVATLLGFALMLTAAIGTLAWPLHSSLDQRYFFRLTLAGAFLLVYAYALDSSGG